MDGLMSGQDDDTGKTEKNDIVAQAKKDFTRAEDAESENRKLGLDDKKFALKGEQWPEQVRKQREVDGRPCLTINRLPSFIRQVVNDARQNKPSIKVHPASDQSDVDTAEVINGLIRNIEQISSADIAYDTAVESAVTTGVGYFRAKLDYAYDDTMDMDILIERVANGFSIYGDPNSTSADGSDWNVAFVLEQYGKEEFDRNWKGKSKVSWDSDAWDDADASWRDGDQITVAEYWTREIVEDEVIELTDGSVHPKSVLDENIELQIQLEMGGIALTDRKRTRKRYKVTQHILTGVEVLETNEWPGKYIPIAVVYGDEFDIEGVRHTRSMIHSAKDAVRMNNYWRSTSTELVALAPRVPFIGAEGSFTDPEKWQTANTTNHPYLEYDPSAGPPPQRQPLDTGVAAGALQEAMNATDDVKAILGMYDASLGARSNETSGRAILARQREGDVSTFHFTDNLSRAIRHMGRIIVDLIPSVYDTPRIVRIIGEDGTEEPVPINRALSPEEMAKRKSGQENEQGELEGKIEKIYDLKAGRYDLTVSSGPSFTTRREEAATSMHEFVRAYPPAAPLLMDLMAKNFDWPGSDELQKRLKAMVPQQAEGGMPPEIMQKMQEVQGQMQQMGQKIEAVEGENQKLKLQLANKQGELAIDKFEADTDRMKVMSDAQSQQVY